MRTPVKWFSVLAAAALLLGLAPVRADTIISGAGATFPYPIYSKWAAAYKAKSGVSLNYQSIGSGGGIKQISAGTVDFGASDAPLAADKLNQLGLLQFPMVMGGVVPVLNVPGIRPGQLKLDGSLLADIYLGKIKRWNDPAIAKLNAGVALPDTKITPVERADGSGTTFIFTHYLSQMSADWKSKVGNNTSVSWPAGVGGKGNEGVSSYVQHIKGGIGYVEYAYALQNKMTYALMRNAAGRYVQPSIASFQAAAANADWAHAPGFNLMLTNQPGAESWPITGATFILVHKVQQKPAIAREVLKFFDWAYHHGDGIAKELDYVPMPKNVVKRVEETWLKEIKGPNGEPVWTAALSGK